MDTSKITLNNVKESSFELGWLLVGAFGGNLINKLIPLQHRAKSPGLTALTLIGGLMAPKGAVRTILHGATYINGLRSANELVTPMLSGCYLNGIGAAIPENVKSIIRMAIPELGSVDEPSSNFRFHLLGNTDATNRVFEQPIAPAKSEGWNVSA